MSIPKTQIGIQTGRVSTDGTSITPSDINSGSSGDAKPLLVDEYGRLITISVSSPITLPQYPSKNIRSQGINSVKISNLNGGNADIIKIRAIKITGPDPLYLMLLQGTIASPPTPGDMPFLVLPLIAIAPAFAEYDAPPLYIPSSPQLTTNYVLALSTTVHNYTPVGPLPSDGTFDYFAILANYY
jgi:hypothetical protein